MLRFLASYNSMFQTCLLCLLSAMALSSISTARGAVYFAVPNDLLAVDRVSAVNYIAEPAG